MTLPAPILRCLGVALLLACGHAPAAPRAPAESATRVYEHTRPALLQVRTLLKSADRQTSIGSGFVVDSQGLALTNYHVVSEYALEPDTYTLQYLTTSGARGTLQLLAIDVPNDLAVVRLDRQDLPALSIDADAVAGRLVKGEKLYSMGNPLDLGFTIVEGIFNGPVDRSYQERIHFTGAINAGMSGGPTVTTRGTVAGVNVARRIDGQLVSFLVPARPAAALLARARSEAPLDLTQARSVIGAQLSERQAALSAALEAEGFVSAIAGPYRAPEGPPAWFTCWARTNGTDQPPPLARQEYTQCESDSDIFVSNELGTGSILVEHELVTSVKLNSFQFATLLSDRFDPAASRPDGGLSLKTPPRCLDRFVEDGEGVPVLRLSWCARAYRDYADLYDISVSAVTQDNPLQALVVRAELRGVSYANGQTLTRRFIDAMRRPKGE
jgi:S1-C subfamily serine protease